MYYDLIGSSDVPHRQKDAFGNRLADFQRIAAEDGSSPPAVHCADADAADRLRRSAEERERACRRNNAHRHPAECKAIAAVRKSAPPNAPVPRRKFAGEQIPADCAVTPQRTHACQDADRKHRRTARDQRNRRSLQIKPCPVHGFNAKKGIDRRQKSAECKGEREKDRRGHAIRFRPFSASREQYQHNAGCKFNDVRCPYGKCEQREHDCKCAARRRGEQQFCGTNPCADAFQRQAEKQTVQQGVFQKGILPIDDHTLPPAPCPSL